MASLHRDQQGTISILTVFTVLLLTMVLGMVMNVGREVDGKIRLQNAADAAAYSGGVVIARGMNTLAFSNNLLCEMFGMVGFMREARDRNAEKYVPSILEAWDRMAPKFSDSAYPKLRALATAIPQRTPLEQETVTSLSDWGQAVSEQTLPFLEEVLRQEWIPEFQRAVIEAYPDIAQQAALEAAQQNSQPDVGRGQILGVLWRTSGVPVGYADETVDRTFPVVDPVGDVLMDQGAYLNIAKGQRARYSRRSLRLWNDRTFRFFDRYAKMSQFGNLWRTFSGGYLEQALAEYPTTNLPFVIRSTQERTLNPNAYLDEYFTFVAVVYWRAQPRRMHTVFQRILFDNPTGADAEAFAQVRVFLPHERLIWMPTGGSDSEIGGMPGEFPPLPDDTLPPSDSTTSTGRRIVGRNPVPTRWNLFSQNWTAQLVPATAARLATILQTEPPIPGFANQGLRLPRYGSLDSQAIERINTH
ncbi:MAG: Tad domain-containing protein [Thermoguttaceae bacterium]